VKEGNHYEEWRGGVMEDWFQLPAHSLLQGDRVRKEDCDSRSSGESSGVPAVVALQGKVNWFGFHQGQSPP